MEIEYFRSNNQVLKINAYKKEQKLNLEYWINLIFLLVNLINSLLKIKSLIK